jgi:RNA polymerase-binding transcription factor
MFKKSEIELFRNKLLANRKILTTAIEGETESSKTVELDQSTMGRLSRMDALQGQAMTQETKLRHEEGLRNISSALSRIESGDYGYCLKCDELISTARLEVDPAVSFCINCASLAEKV